MTGEPTIDVTRLARLRGDRPTLTEMGNALRFACMHGHRLRYIHATRQWYAWDGTRWRRDERGVEVVAAKEVVAALYAEGQPLLAKAAAAMMELDGDEATKKSSGYASALLDHAKKSSKANAIGAMIRLARSEEPIAAVVSDFDQDPLVLNVLNGTLDLRTGKLRPHRQADMLTRLAPVAYDDAATCPRWDAFLERVLPDAEVRQFVQRYIGYALTGNVDEQILMFAFGSGANGKSVLLDVLLELLGDYALRAAPDLILAKHGEGHPTEQADLEGRRLVVCSEIEQGRAWAESTIKRITGDRTITARRMKQDFYTFPATHKIIVAANSKPTVKGADFGIWRRMRLVPFGVTIPPEERIKGFDQQLIAEEAPGILAWAVRGCLEWRADGMTEPAVVTEATEGYRAEQDIIGLWIAEECVLVPGAFAPIATLYESYTAWCGRMGREPWTQHTVRARLLERQGLAERRTTNARGVSGIGMVRHDGPEAGA